MNDEKQSASLALRIATLAILTAVTTVFTLVVRIPIMPTRGYLNLGDVAIYFAAFTLGPFTALIAGGLGTAFADLISGYSQWAPLSLIIHGGQGFLAGLIAVIATRKTNRTGFSFFWLLAAVVGTVFMCAGYFVSGGFMYGFAAALTELPGNVLQNLAGVLGGIPLAIAVRRAFPPVAQLRW